MSAISAKSCTAISAPRSSRALPAAGSPAGGTRPAGSRALVIDLIGSTLPYTLQLAALALVFTFLIAVPLGIAGGLYAGRWPDKLALYLSSVFVSVPNFWFAIVLALIVTARLQWIPSIGYKGFAYTILPALVIAVEMSPLFIRALSVSVADTLRRTSSSSRRYAAYRLGKS